MLDHAAFNMKAIWRAFGMGMRVGFLDRVAIIANEEFCPVVIMIVVTGYVGVQRFHAMDKAKFGEKVQSPVNCWGFGRPALGFELFEQVISLYGTVRLKNQLEYVGTKGSEALSMCIRNLPSIFHTGFNVLGISRWGGHISLSGLSFFYPIA